LKVFYRAVHVKCSYGTLNADHITHAHNGMLYFVNFSPSDMVIVLFSFLSPVFILFLCFFFFVALVANKGIQSGCNHYDGIPAVNQVR